MHGYLKVCAVNKNRFNLTKKFLLTNLIFLLMFPFPGTSPHSLCRSNTPFHLIPLFSSVIKQPVYTVWL